MRPFALALFFALPLSAQQDINPIHIWDLAREEPGQLTIYNPDANDAEFGTPVRAGDLNGDGFDDLVVSAMAGDEERAIFGIKTEVADLDADGANDLLVGAFYANGPARANAGKLYLISGMLLRERLAAERTLDLARTWPAGVAVAIGAEPRSRLGVWVAAGDINGFAGASIRHGATTSGHDHYLRL